MRFNHNFLRSLQQNDHMAWSIAVSELIDNALDAQARQIAIHWGTKSFEIRDDGIGISPDGFAALYTLGGHIRPVARTATIGRYGIGFKEAAGWLWGITTIRSLHRPSDSRVQELRIHWEYEATRGEEASSHVPVRSRAGRIPGTTIQCADIRREAPSGEYFARFVAQLMHTYRPALETGIVITLRRLRDMPIVLHPAPWPPQAPDAPRVDGTVVVAGRIVPVVAYVTAENHEYPGVHLGCHGRAMGRVTTKQNSRRVYGWAQLGDEWEVGKNKTEITDLHRDALGLAITAFCQPVFDAAEAEAQRVQLAALRTNLLYDLRNALAAEQVQPGRVPGFPPGGPPRGGARVPCATPTASGPHPPRERADPAQHTAEPSTAPYIHIRYGPVPTGQVMMLDVTPSMWTVVIDDRHPFVTRYLLEPCFGARGHDETRALSAVISTIAAATQTSEEVAAALPRLDGIPVTERFGTACALLWEAHFAARAGGQSTEREATV